MIHVVLLAIVIPIKISFVLNTMYLISHQSINVFKNRDAEKSVIYPIQEEVNTNGCATGVKEIWACPVKVLMELLAAKVTIIVNFKTVMKACIVQNILILTNQTNSFHRYVYLETTAAHSVCFLIHTKPNQMHMYGIHWVSQIHGIGQQISGIHGPTVVVQQLILTKLSTLYNISSNVHSKRTKYVVMISWATVTMDLIAWESSLVILAVMMLVFV